MSLYGVSKYLLLEIMLQRAFLDHLFWVTFVPIAVWQYLEEEFLGQKVYAFKIFLIAISKLLSKENESIYERSRLPIIWPTQTFIEPFGLYCSGWWKMMQNIIIVLTVITLIINEAEPPFIWLVRPIWDPGIFICEVFLYQIPSGDIHPLDIYNCTCVELILTPNV